MGKGIGEGRNRMTCQVIRHNLFRLLASANKRMVEWEGNTRRDGFKDKEKDLENGNEVGVEVVD